MQRRGGVVDANARHAASAQGDRGVAEAGRVRREERRRCVLVADCGGGLGGLRGRPRLPAFVSHDLLGRSPGAARGPEERRRRRSKVSAVPCGPVRESVLFRSRVRGAASVRRTRGFFFASTPTRAPPSHSSRARRRHGLVSTPAPRPPPPALARARHPVLRIISHLPLHAPLRAPVQLPHLAGRPRRGGGRRGGRRRGRRNISGSVSQGVQGFETPRAGEDRRGPPRRRRYLLSTRGPRRGRPLPRVAPRPIRRHRANPLRLHVRRGTRGRHATRARREAHVLDRLDTRGRPAGVRPDGPIRRRGLGGGEGVSL